jgi:hypothetical protein
MFFKEKKVRRDGGIGQYKSKIEDLQVNGESVKRAPYLYG